MSNQKQQDPKVTIPVDAPKQPPKEQLLDMVIDVTTHKAEWETIEGTEVSVSIDQVQKLFSSPTKAGNRPSAKDMILFLRLCQARKLNPYVGDALLVGYDTRNDGPKFQTITTFQAILKRAEASPHYEGEESGVIVKNKDGSVEQLTGSFYDNATQILLGAWAVAHRKNRRFPKKVTITLASRRQNSPFWEKDAGGMIVKCAISQAIREAFPNEAGGLYAAEELMHYEPMAEVPQTPVLSVSPITARAILPSTTRAAMADIAKPSPQPVQEQHHVNDSPETQDDYQTNDDEEVQFDHSEPADEGDSQDIPI